MLVEEWRDLNQSQIPFNLMKSFFMLLPSERCYLLTPTAPLLSFKNKFQIQFKFSEVKDYIWRKFKGLGLSA